MKINNIKVTREDFECLAKTLDNFINELENGAVNEVIEGLNKIKNRLEDNLKADDELQERELRIHDKVEVKSSDDKDLEDYIGKVGWIIDINLQREYPYEVEFEDKSFLNDWLWKKEDLKLI